MTADFYLVIAVILAVLFIVVVTILACMIYRRDKKIVQIFEQIIKR